MGKRASVPIIILSVLIALSLVVAGGLYYMFGQEQKKGLELQEKLEEISTKQRITENKLKESEKFINDLQQRLMEAKSQMDSLASGLQQEKSARQEALAKLELLRTDIEQQKFLRLDLEKKLTQAQDDVKKTQAQLSDLQSQKTTLESKIKDLETKTQGVELGKIIVSPEPLPAEPEPAGKKAKKQKVEKKEKAEKKEKKEKKAKEIKEPVKEEAAAVASGLEGKVLVVNKDYNFVVISLGSKDGIALGDKFSLFHNDKYVGDIKVEKVHDSMSAAGFEGAAIKDRVYEGDKVTKKNK